MRVRTMLGGLMILAVACGGFTGCSSEAPGTDLPVEKPLTPEKLKAEQDKVHEGMKGYQGAPGAPPPK